VGALYLQALDMRLERLGLFYVRFMDDWVAMAPTRRKLRRAIKIVNQALAELKVGRHPDKTTIGSIARGFDLFRRPLCHRGALPGPPNHRPF
jgi:RNA-directed DNA polymerase